MELYLLYPPEQIDTLQQSSALCHLQSQRCTSCRAGELQFSWKNYVFVVALQVFLFKQVNINPQRPGEHVWWLKVAFLLKCRAANSIHKLLDTHIKRSFSAFQWYHMSSLGIQGVRSERDYNVSLCSIDSSRKTDIVSSSGPTGDKLLFFMFNRYTLVTHLNGQ